MPGRRVVLGPGCEAVRAAAGPLAWVVLEDLALVADVDPSTGRVVAHTSAARIAGRVGLTKGTAARALQQLRAVGLVVLDRPLGDRGRFDGSAYRVLPVDGLHLESAPHVDPPAAVSPLPVEPAAAAPSADNRVKLGGSVDQLRSAGDPCVDVVGAPATGTPNPGRRATGRRRARALGPTAQEPVAVSVPIPDRVHLADGDQLSLLDLPPLPAQSGPPP